MNVDRLTPNIGARISGLDLRGVQLSQRGELRGLLEEHLVLFFVGQQLSLDEFQHFGEVMGELKRGVATPGFRGPDDYIIRIEVPPGTRRGGYADRWHTDEPYLEEPNTATILMPDCLPSAGGDTCWASMYAAYDLLSEPLKRLADELAATHFTAGRFKGEWTHPVVRVNPKTGRRALYVNSIFTRDIANLSAQESKEVLDLFVRLATPPEAQVRYRWTPDTVAIWDNRFSQHYAVSDYSEPRRMFRMLVRGEPVVGLRDAVNPPPAAPSVERATTSA
jgi:taurine dioxygenase